MKPATHEWFERQRKRLHQLYPAAFPADGEDRPALIVGIHRDLEAFAGMSRADARGFLRFWTGRPRYLASLAAGGMRVNLGGEPLGPIHPSHQEHARRRLQKREEVRAARRAKRQTISLVFDPIHRDDENNLWYFWDESQADRFGPFPTESHAREASDRYAAFLDTGKTA